MKKIKSRTKEERKGWTVHTVWDCSVETEIKLLPYKCKNTIKIHNFKSFLDCCFLVQYSHLMVPRMIKSNQEGRRLSQIIWGYQEINKSTTTIIRLEIVGILIVFQLKSKKSNLFLSITKQIIWGQIYTMKSHKYKHRL